MKVVDKNELRDLMLRDKDFLARLFTSDILSITKKLIVNAESSQLCLLIQILHYLASGSIHHSFLKSQSDTESHNVQELTLNMNHHILTLLFFLCLIYICLFAYLKSHPCLTITICKDCLRQYLFAFANKNYKANIITIFNC